jgi:L-cysteine/cystine lyase
MLDSTIDMAYIRQEIPGVTSHIHLNTASFGPVARCVPQAMEQWMRQEWSEGRLGMAAYEAMATVYAEARASIARLLHAGSEEIALTENTGEGLNIICSGFNWQPGDEIILTSHEHISLLALVDQLHKRYGVVLRTADLGPTGERSADEVIGELITPRTRLIVLSHVSFMTGAVLDVRAVADLARQSQIPVLVDGAQSVGVIPVDVKALGVDFYAFPMQKWLCGPDGTGALYVRRESLNLLQPTYVGWYVLQFEGMQWKFHDSAQRFELGGRQTAAVAGQIACLRWLEETITYPWIVERISALNRSVYNALKDISGLTVLTPQPGSSGLLTFSLAGSDEGELVHWLQHEQDIYVRAIHEHSAVRVSTGFYNTEEEIDRLTQALRDWLLLQTK